MTSLLDQLVVDSIDSNKSDRYTDKADLLLSKGAKDGILV